MSSSPCSGGSSHSRTLLLDALVQRRQSGSDIEDDPSLLENRWLGDLDDDDDESMHEKKTQRKHRETGVGPLYSLRRMADINPTFFDQVKKFVACFVGLQTAYVTWGFMQELIMTSQFQPSPRNPTGRFPSSIFCVLSNRCVGLMVSIIAVKMRHGSLQSKNSAPLRAFSPCALSNAVSSWCQYSALKFVSFPVSAVFKSSSIPVVMIVGRFLHGTSYPVAQYVEALFITIGVAVFAVSSRPPSQETETQVAGFLLLTMYVISDSFTAQYQSRIYVKYGKSNLDHYQMMLGVSLNVVVISFASLVISGDIPIVLDFFSENPHVLRYNLVASTASSLGQLCIFYTIKEFGPIVFAIVMTTRQMVSIFISSTVFGHLIPPRAFVGAAVVFSVLFYQIRRKYYAAQRNAEGSD